MYNKLEKELEENLKLILEGKLKRLLISVNEDDYFKIIEEITLKLPEKIMSINKEKEILIQRNTRQEAFCDLCSTIDKFPKDFFKPSGRSLNEFQDYRVESSKSRIHGRQIYLAILDNLYPQEYIEDIFSRYSETLRCYLEPEATVIYITTFSWNEKFLHSFLESENWKILDFKENYV